MIFWTFTDYHHVQSRMLMKISLQFHWDEKSWGTFIWVNDHISLTWIVGPFGDDSPNIPYHDSRARSRREVVMKFTQFHIPMDLPMDHDDHDHGIRWDAGHGMATVHRHLFVDHELSDPSLGSFRGLLSIGEIWHIFGKLVNMCAYYFKHFFKTYITTYIVLINIVDSDILVYVFLFSKQWSIDLAVIWLMNNSDDYRFRAITRYQQVYQISTHHSPVRANILFSWTMRVSGKHTHISINELRERIIITVDSWHMLKLW